MKSLVVLVIALAIFTSFLIAGRLNESPSLGQSPIEEVIR